VSHPATALRPWQRRGAELALVGVTLLWGLTFPLIRQAVDPEVLSPFHFMAARFVVAALACTPLVLISPRARAGLRHHWAASAGLGVLLWASYQTQVIGLVTVPAGRAAFITGSSVVMVPLLAPLFRAGRPTGVDLLAAFVACVGLYLLTMGDAPAADVEAGGIGAGDLWILACAGTYAVYIHLLQKLLHSGCDEVAVVYQQIVAVAACSCLTLPVAPAALADQSWSPAALTAILFCALGATVICFWLQARYQQRTTPTRTALIFSLEPVFAALFAWLLLAEIMGPRAILGAATILAAVVGSELLHARRRRIPPTPTPARSTPS
jgi:drug/metabolite transporter (DMT)-like permease